jgi:hypothetical protein
MMFDHILVTAGGVQNVLWNWSQRLDAPIVYRASLWPYARYHSVFPLVVLVWVLVGSAAKILSLAATVCHAHH